MNRENSIMSATFAAAAAVIACMLLIATFAEVFEVRGKWECTDGEAYRGRCGAKIHHRCTKYHCHQWTLVKHP